jgi:hypothetical protein
MPTWKNIANCLRCGAPIYSACQSEGDDPPKTMYSCRCWDDKPVTDWYANITKTYTDKVDKS